DRWGRAIRDRQDCLSSTFQFRPQRRGQLPGHAEMRHRVDAIGGDLEVENSVRAVLLDGIDGVADLSKPPAEIVVREGGEVYVVAEPVAGQFHGRAIVPLSFRAAKTARNASPLIRPSAT